jgi:hypothetical protein
VFLPKPLAAAVAFIANGLSGVTGKPNMINPGKIRELYHDDWVARGQELTPADPILFARGFPDTLAWYRAAGWLPPGRSADRSSGSFNREAGE